MNLNGLPSQQNDGLSTTVNNNSTLTTGDIVLGGLIVVGAVIAVKKAIDWWNSDKPVETKRVSEMTGAQFKTLLPQPMSQEQSTQAYAQAMVAADNIRKNAEKEAHDKASRERLDQVLQALANGQIKDSTGKPVTIG